AAVMRSSIPGAHARANQAARIDVNRAESRVKLGNLEGALEALHAAARKDSLASEVFELIGAIELRRGHSRAAYDAFRRAAVLARGHYGTAEQALKIHAFEAPGDLAGRQFLAQAERALGKHKDADHTLLLLRADIPDQSVWLTEAGLAKRSLGDRDSALVLFR